MAGVTKANAKALDSRKDGALIAEMGKDLRQSRFWGVCMSEGGGRTSCSVLDGGGLRYCQLPNLRLRKGSWTHELEIWGEGQVGLSTGVIHARGH